MASTMKTQSNRFIVGTKSYFDQEMPRLARDFSEYDTVDRQFMPFSFNMDNSDDGHYQELQQKMMDFGWRLNEDEDGHQYFTHPTYQGTEYDVYYHTLKNGRSVSLPIVPREEDPKGLGCSVIVTHGAGNYKVETNEWKSYWDNRNGRRRARYLNYLDKRQKKREEFVEMAKTDSSIKVWTKDTPRCDPLTWEHNNRTTLGQYTELVA